MRGLARGVMDFYFEKKKKEVILLYGLKRTIYHCVDVKLIFILDGL